MTSQVRNLRCRSIVITITLLRTGPWHKALSYTVMMNIGSTLKELYYVYSEAMNLSHFLAPLGTCVILSLTHPQTF